MWLLSEPAGVLSLLWFLVSGCSAPWVRQQSSRPRLATDLKEVAFVSKQFEECSMISAPWECNMEYHGAGIFDGAQHTGSLDRFGETQDLLQRPRASLLILVSSIWRNVDRRHFFRDAIYWCQQGVMPHLRTPAIKYSFLLGDPTQEFLDRAVHEMAHFDDVFLAGGPDEMNYSHIGDNYRMDIKSPELYKLTVALRFYMGSLDFDFVLSVDDDAFVNIPAALELLSRLPKERVYIGNMIDSIPQRWNSEKRRVEQVHSVNEYLGMPGKTPIFAHGMGFVFSKDIAQLVADLGLEMKSFGNEDVLFGMWVRTLEHLHQLNYRLWFHDHEDFPGIFSMSCDISAVVVHRMNVSRWKRFHRYECHVCMPQELVAHLPDYELLPSEAPPTTRYMANTPVHETADQPQACVSEQELACKWPEALHASAGRMRLDHCMRLCEAQARFEEHPAGCPPSLCHALCNRRKLCSDVATLDASQYRALLVIAILGSSWSEPDTQLRQLLRTSLRSCSARRMGVSRVHSLFVMEALPTPGQESRQAAVAEMLVHGDIALSSLKSSHTSGSPASAAQTILSAWRAIQERFGTSEYILFLDHRSYVNVPFLFNGLLPALPREKIYVGCMIEPNLFQPCGADTLCGYLKRRRAAMFAHGMGFLVSRDVMEFISDMSSWFPLREYDMPADVAFGMWVQPFEDLVYNSQHVSFHMWSDASVTRDDQSSHVLSQPVSPESIVVFPMTRFRWTLFDDKTCTLAEPPALPLSNLPW